MHTGSTSIMNHQCASSKQRLPRAGRGGGLIAAARPRPSLSSVVIVSSKAAAQSTTIATSVADDPYADLAACAGVVVESKNGGGPRAVAGVTALGRGLVLDGDAPAQRGATLVSVPIANALVIADEPMGGISAFSDRQHAAWQAAHGDMPSALLDFITGEERWDARMAAWLLYVRRHHQGALWRRYAALLPAARDAACLLAFREADEAAALQLPELIEEATVQTRWAAYLHRMFFAAGTFASSARNGGGSNSGSSSSGGKGAPAMGKLASLRLSDTLDESLWAIAMVRSRTFSDEINGEGITLMVPYCDLANHGGDARNATFGLGRGGQTFELTATAAVPAGAELLITYGEDKPNYELLRDYGFTVPGNPYDRVPFERLLAEAERTSGGGGSGGDNGVGQQTQQQQQQQQQQQPKQQQEGKGPPLPGLNPASLLEAAGFAGDLAKGKVGPLSGGGDGTTDAARRRAALLSMPLAPPPTFNRGGLFGWAAPVAWSPSGEPPPRPLAPAEVPAERASVAALRRAIASRRALLGTTLETDAALLERAAGGGSDKGAAAAGGSAQPLAPRVEAAVRARLEHKRLLEQADLLLAKYERALASGRGPSYMLPYHRV